MGSGIQFFQTACLAVVAYEIMNTLLLIYPKQAKKIFGSFAIFLFVFFGCDI